MTPFGKLKRDFAGKKVLIFGLGVLGRGADVAKLFVEIGAKVTATDIKTAPKLGPSLKRLRGLPISYILGRHRAEDIVNTDVIIRNPGVPWNHHLLERARQVGIPVLMDTALFMRYFEGTSVGITGTRGKTTTTLLIRALLSTGNRTVFLAGNATRKANCRLLTHSSQSLAVMELSSWELQGFRDERRSPNIAVVTNLYADHLNTYKSMEEYAADKEAIFRFQNKRETVILNRENPYTKKMAERVRSVVRWFSKEDFPSSWKLPLRGAHNFENAAAALKVADLFGVPKDIEARVFAGFSAVEHRLETVGRYRGIEFVNDTTATTPIATIKALQAINQPTILLVGGNSKNLPLEELPGEIEKHVKAVVILKGTGSRLLVKALKPWKDLKVYYPSAFDQAVRTAIKLASPGDVVLLSPAFTSFAEFSNEFERGERFNSLVKGLTKRKEREK